MCKCESCMKRGLVSVYLGFSVSLKFANFEIRRWNWWDASQKVQYCVGGGDDIIVVDFFLQRKRCAGT